jgi:hypothetical protein
MPQIAEWRMAHDNLRGMHVDHVYPFSCILKDFLRIHKYDEAYLQTVRVKDGHFNDAIMEIMWVSYHRIHATFQYLTPEQNMKKGALVSDFKMAKNIHDAFEAQRKEKDISKNWTSGLCIVGVSDQGDIDENDSYKSDGSTTTTTKETKATEEKQTQTQR